MKNAFELAHQRYSDDLTFFGEGCPLTERNVDECLDDVTVILAMIRTLASGALGA